MRGTLIVQAAAGAAPPSPAGAGRRGPEPPPVGEAPVARPAPQSAVMSPIGAAPRAGGMPPAAMVLLLLGTSATVIVVSGMMYRDLRRAGRRLQQLADADAPAEDR